MVTSPPSEEGWKEKGKRGWGVFAIQAWNAWDREKKKNSS
jgi:hypothetical protein